MSTGSVQRMLARLGRTVTLRTYTASGSEDEYGDPTTPTASTASINAVRSSSKEVSRLNSSRGGGAFVDAAFIVHEDDAPANPEPEAQYPPVIVDDGQEFRVMSVVPDGALLGTRRLLCEAMR